MTVWFTADTHFGYVPVVTACGRPYRSVAEHDRDLIERWNAVVRPGDDVWHLGDFADGMAPAASLTEILLALNGRVSLVSGNHDNRRILRLPWADRPISRGTLEIDGVRVLLSHHPLNMVCRAYPGAINLHGHTHGTEPGWRTSLDVGVDCHDYSPISWPQVRRLLGV